MGRGNAVVIHSGTDEEHRLDGIRVWLCVLLSLYLALACSYAVATPLFESPDESSHLQVIDYIRREHRWPPYQVPEVRATTGPSMAWLISYHDPPLYYAPPLYHTFAAWLTAWTPMADLEDRLIPSLSWQQGYAPVRSADPWNKNVFVHLPGETIAESGTVRAAALLRGVSILLGGVVIVCAYGIGITVWPSRPWVGLGAAACLVLNPQFVASHSGVSNDPLTNALFSLSLLGVLRLMSGQASWLRWAGLGIVAGLGHLTKQSALMILPIGGLGALFSALEGHHLDRDGARLLRGTGRAAAFGVVAILVGGGWYLTNSLFHGDPLGTRPHFDIQVPLPSFGIGAAWSTLQSSWAAFGWALITPPWWAYVPLIVTLALAVTAVVGAFLPHGSFRTETVIARRAMGLLVMAFALNLVAFVRWATATGAPYGRLLFPTAGSVAVLVSWGLSQWRCAWARGAYVGLAVYAGLVALLLPWSHIRPAFRSPYQGAELPATATSTSGTGAGDVSFVGYALDAESLTTGNRLTADLYWRAEASSDQSGSDAALMLSAQLRGIDPTKRVADDTRWLGGTLYPSAYWRQGDVVAHRVTLQIPEWAPVPGLMWLDLKVIGEDGALLIYEPGGQDTLSLGPWRVRGAVEIPDTAIRVDARLGAGIELAAYDLATENDHLLIDLYWRAVGVTEGDATVFLHLLSATGDLVAQDDGLPAEGAYPTSWWLEGDVVRDRHVVSATGEGALVRVGMYISETGMRIPAFGPDGERLEGDAVSLYLPR